MVALAWAVGARGGGERGSAEPDNEQGGEGLEAEGLRAEAAGSRLAWEHGGAQAPTHTGPAPPKVQLRVSRAMMLPARHPQSLPSAAPVLAQDKALSLHPWVPGHGRVPNCSPQMQPTSPSRYQAVEHPAKGS